MSQTSEFLRTATNAIIGAPAGNKTTNNPNLFEVGVISAGPSKSELDRTLCQFDLYGAASVGRPLVPGDTITAMELKTHIVNVIGTSGFTCYATRIIRTDWDPSTATWNIYKAGNNWTTAGADSDGNDIDTTTPARVSFTSPTATGDQTVISGLVNFGTDAMSNRSGIVRIRIHANDETNFDHQFGGDPATVRLLVTYDPNPNTQRARGGFAG